MSSKLQTLHSAELEHVVGGFDPSSLLGMIGPIGNMVSQGLASSGNQKGAQEASKWTGIVQQFAGNIMSAIGQGGGGQGGGTQTA